MPIDFFDYTFDDPRIVAGAQDAGIAGLLAGMQRGPQYGSDWGGFLSGAAMGLSTGKNQYLADYLPIFIRQEQERKAEEERQRLAAVAQRQSEYARGQIGQVGAGSGFSYGNLPPSDIFADPQAEAEYLLESLLPEAQDAYNDYLGDQEAAEQEEALKALLASHGLPYIPGDPARSAEALKQLVIAENEPMTKGQAANLSLNRMTEARLQETADWNREEDIRGRNQKLYDDAVRQYEEGPMAEFEREWAEYTGEGAGGRAGIIDSGLGIAVTPEGVQPGQARVPPRPPAAPRPQPADYGLNYTPQKSVPGVTQAPTGTSPAPTQKVKKPPAQAARPPEEVADSIMATLPINIINRESMKQLIIIELKTKTPSQVRSEILERARESRWWQGGGGEPGPRMFNSSN